MADRFENGIFGMIPQDEWLNVGWQPVTRPNDPIDTLFSDTKTDNITAKWETIASEYQIPVMAQFHGFDTESLTTFRIPVENKYIEKGLIKVKINQSERMRALLRSGVKNDEMYDYVINDGVRLADQVITRTKVAKNELMATGKVTIKENNLNLTIDYGVPNTHTEFELDLDEHADIVSQMQDIIDFATAKGVTINGMITAKKNINKMRRNANLQVAINGNVGAGTMIRQTALESFFNDEFGITRILTNDQSYGASGTIGADGQPNIVTKRYFPDNKVTFFASNGGNIGTGLWGDPPEVDDFEHKVNASGQSPYVYISQKMEWDPHVLWTKASGLFIPVLYNPYSLFIATVVGDGEQSPRAKALKSTDTVYGTSVSDMADGIIVGADVIGGKLKYLNSGQIVSDWGAGNFLPITFDANDWTRFTSVKVGLQPSAGAGMQELIGHLDDLDSIFKITDKNVQKLVIEASNGTSTSKRTYDLSGLTMVQGA